MNDFSLSARWILTAVTPPLPHAIIHIQDDKITAIDPHGTRTPDIDLGNVAILPGLVNAHTHLDLTGLRGQCPPSPDFTQWLRRVIAYRRSHSATKIDDDIQIGLKSAIASGSTLIGDISAEGASWMALADAPLRAVVFHELLGLSPERARQAEVIGLGWLNEHVPTATCRAALSPHAPYSVHKSLFQLASGITDNYDVPLTTHLAETRDELQLLTHHRGPFEPFLKELSAWELSGLAASLEEVIGCCLAASPLLLVHCNYLSPQVELHPYTTIVYCPRTHAAFGHPPHPFREFLQRGVRVALGTDSLASNPDLDILAEMRFIHQRYPDFPGNQLLRMGTLSGAEALGWADECGSLEHGKSADLAIVPLANEEGDPYELLWTSPHHVSGTMFRGQWIYPPPS
jgi:aminodeoxyfutalosine deaminase